MSTQRKFYKSTQVCKRCSLLFVSLLLLCSILYGYINQKYSFSDINEIDKEHCNATNITSNISDADNVSVTNEWHHIIKQRNIMPSKCDNSEHNNIININPISNNWAPFYFRCNYDSDKLHESNIIIGELFYSKELNYIHNYKAGGTTIQYGLNKLSKQNKLNITSKIQHIYHGGGSEAIHKIPFSRSINNESIIFTFIRHPIQKFLSGFFEANKRMFQHKINQIPSNKNGIEILREWIHKILQHIQSQKKLIGKRKMLKLQKIPNYRYINFHLNQNFMELAPVHNLFNFIGNLENLNNDLPQIISKFIIDDELQNNVTALMQYFKHERNRNNINYVNHEKLNMFNIKESELSDDDISKLCRIYWFDFICFPFKLPKQCNITNLFIEYYYQYIQYNSCY